VLNELVDAGSVLYPMFSHLQNPRWRPYFLMISKSPKITKYGRHLGFCRWLNIGYDTRWLQLSHRPAYEKAAAAPNFLGDTCDAILDFAGG
jgi:hypothetical protein